MWQQSNIPLRAWIQADDKIIPAVAKGTDIQITHNRIVLFFSDDGCELYAIALGKHYEIQEAVQIKANFTVKNGKLVPEKPNYSYAQIFSDLAKQAVGYYGNSQDPNPVRIVNEITGKDQMTIADGGIVTLSDNLQNILVRVVSCPIVFPQIIVVSNADVEKFTIRIIFTIEGKSKLATIPGCELVKEHQESYATRRRIEFVLGVVEWSDL